MGDARPTPIGAQKHDVPARRHVGVLIVDDDADTRDLLEVMLVHAGYSVATACNGSEALSLLQSIQPEMILLDIQMPVMDGAQFREAQRRDCQLVRIPTAVMTGSKEEPVLDIGVAATLAKPFRKQDLLPIVERFCASH